MPYSYYQCQTIPCPDCDTCERHDTPEIHVGKRYFRRNDDGTDTPITEEEYYGGAYRYRDQPGNRPG